MSDRLLGEAVQSTLTYPAQTIPGAHPAGYRAADVTAPRPQNDVMTAEERRDGGTKRNVLSHICRQLLQEGTRRSAAPRARGIGATIFVLRRRPLVHKTGVAVRDYAKNGKFTWVSSTSLCSHEPWETGGKSHLFVGNRKRKLANHDPPK